MLQALFKRLLIPIISILLVVLYHLGTTTIIDEARSYLFVVPISVIVVLCSLFIILKEVKAYYKKNIKNEQPEELNILTRNKITLIVASLSYLLLIQVIGVKISTLLITFVLLFAYEVRNKIILIGVPVLLVLIVYSLFELGLNVPFPEGLLG